jgi:AcrR family transcriptional regulator
MGLREKKAQRTRDRIITDAMTLFAASGYELTTMEAIAAAADLSPSTLYRYFPTKDSIVLATFFGNTARFAEVFAARVQHMPPQRALAEGIFAVLAVEDERPDHALLVRSLLGQSPVARARLWDYLGEQQHQLTLQLAAALHQPADDPAIELAARIALQVLLATADLWRATKLAAAQSAASNLPTSHPLESTPPLSSRAIAENLMRLLTQGAILFPEPAQP